MMMINRKIWRNDEHFVRERDVCLAAASENENLKEISRFGTDWPIDCPTDSQFVILTRIMHSYFGRAGGNAFLDRVNKMHQDNGDCGTIFNNEALIECESLLHEMNG